MTGNIDFIEFFQGVIGGYLGYWLLLSYLLLLEVIGKLPIQKQLIPMRFYKF